MKNATLSPDLLTGNASDYYGHVRPEIASLVPTEITKLLDVGCGAGAFGASLKSSRSAPLEVWGIEPNPQAAEEAGRHLDKVILGSFEERLPLPRDYFDVVTFNDSLEHMPDPMQPLALARDVLKESGVLICSVPNVRYIDNLKHLLVDADWKYKSEGILDRTHLRFFTRKSLERTLVEAGFYPVQCQGINARPWIGLKLKILLFIMKNRLDDIQYLQIAAVATKNKPTSHMSQSFPIRNSGAAL